jgi:hypothetical protein
MGSNRLHEITELLSASPLADILVPGFFSPDDRYPIFHPQPMTVYLVFKDGIIECKSVDQYDHLRMKVASAIHLDVVADEDDEIGLTSDFELFLGDAYNSARCTHLRYFTDPDSDPMNGLIKCGEFCFERSKSVFLDPTHTFGIHIGNSEQRDRWINDYFRTSGKYSEHWWRPEANSQAF